MTLGAEIADLIRHQQMLVAMSGTAMMGGALFFLRQLPAHMLGFLKDRFTVSVTIESDDETYEAVNVWLARHRKAKVARRLMIQRGYCHDSDKWRTELTLGHGSHLMWFGRRPLMVSREVEKLSGADRIVSGSRRERLTVTALGRSQAPVRELIRVAEAANSAQDKIKVFYWSGGYYRLADHRAKRPLESVFIPEDQKDRIIGDLARFNAERETYRRRGIPYRRGYLFEGPPGTGKSTLVHLLASVASRPIYLINLNNLCGDNELIAAFNEADADGIVVIEDIDAAKITHSREPGPRKRASAGAPDERRNESITLSGLLNAIDGVAAREGRILCITSNHADKLDAALVRPGRVDIRESIQPLGRDEAWRMFLAFHPDGTGADFDQCTRGRLPITGASLQNLLLAPSLPAQIAAVSQAA